MVIDDDEIDQELFARIANRAGIVDQLLQFPLATQAMQYLMQPDREAIDLIALDIKMPTMNGYEFLEAVTAEFGERFAAAVIVMLTTPISPQDSAYLLSFSVVKGFSNKPITVEALRNWPGIVSGRPGP